MIAVLFSSGIDSWACLNWAVHNYGSKNVLPLYIDFGQSYAAKEIEHAERMCGLLYVTLHVKKVEGVLVENSVTKHVPFRNLMFLQMAAMYQDVTKIAFGMVKGDWGEDKNPAFVRDVERMLNSQLVGTLHHKISKIEIVTPFANYTKAQVVEWLLITSRPGIEGVRETIGCYSANNESCGQCISCFTRWVALYLNGMHSDRPDHIYVQWIVEQFSAKNNNSKKEMAKLLWKKRAFVFDAHKALNKHCQENFDKSFANAYLFT